MLLFPAPIIALIEIIIASFPATFIAFGTIVDAGNPLFITVVATNDGCELWMEENRKRRKRKKEKERNKRENEKEYLDR